MHFHSGSYDELEAFISLEKKILSMEDALGQNAQCLFYISTPQVFLNLFLSIWEKVDLLKDINLLIVLQKLLSKNLL